MKGGECMDIAILFPDHPVNYELNNAYEQPTHKNSEIYSTFFQQTLAETTSLNISNETFIKKFVDLPLSILKQLYNTLVDHDEIPEEMIAQIIELTDTEQQEIADHMNLQIIVEQLAQIISIKEKENKSIILPDQSQPSVYVEKDTINEQNQDRVNDDAIFTKMQHLFIQVQTLLENLSTEEQIANIAPKILELLEKWSLLENETKHVYQYQNSISLQNEDQIDVLWKELLNSYQKRTQLFTKQQYNVESQVTTKDIVKWLQNVMTRQIRSSENVPIKQMNLANVPVSNIEHYIIHMHQNISSKPIETQLVEQFQQVLRSSQFLTNNNGLNQLAITLRPENLGEMVVRFTEINGEITLKIIVSSQVTKQMLESNIHELRTMFSPHQISIEEQEFDLQQIQQQLEDEFMEEQNQDQSEHHQEEKQSSDHTFEEEFHNLLMNEKV